MHILRGVFIFYRVTSWIVVEGLAEIATVDETTDNTLCQEKHAYRNLVAVDDLGR